MSNSTILHANKKHKDFLIYANKTSVLSNFAFFPCLYEINVVSLHDF